MKSVLVGNGINIQFGGSAYNSDFIMKRIKYASKLDKYDSLFGNKLNGAEINRMLEDFVSIANAIRLGEYDRYADNDDVTDALSDFQTRYDNEIEMPHDIMLEDWFLVVHMFFLKNSDLEEERVSAVQGFERLILDAIYNNGKIQSLYTKMNKKTRKFFCSFDNIFSLNYDNNLEQIIRKPVYHLHGDFSVLANSENINNVQGYIRKRNGETVCLKEMQHCFCNALLNYSGKLKYKIAEACHALILDSETYSERYLKDPKFKEALEQLEKENPIDYKLIMTKIEHPELNMSTEYHFDVLKNIQGELSIIGMSPNNDAHIFNIILNNPQLSKVTFYYYGEKEKKYIEEHFHKDLFECKSVGSLWKSLNCKNPKYNFNYNVPDSGKDLINILSVLSDDKIDFKKIKEEINKIPQSEMIRLCTEVKADMALRNPDHSSVSEKDLRKGLASISYIALQEGVFPTVLFLICIMNIDYI